MSEDADLRVRDFRSDPTERLRRSKLSYLSNVPATDELPVRAVHPIQRLRQLSMQSRDAMDAWVRHAAAANGFGDGGMASKGGNASDGAIVERAERPRVRKHLSLARHRMRAMGEAIAAMIWVAYWLIASFIRSRARTPQAAPTYRAVTPKPRPIPTLRQSRVS